MPAVFKTKKDAGDPYEISGAGQAGPGGKGGIDVERASLVMSELQEKNDDGSLKMTDEGQPIPLTGNALSSAAREYASAHGLEVANISEEKMATLAEEVGAAPDRPPLAEVAAEEYERMYGHLNLEKKAEPEGEPPEEEKEGGKR